ncbi:hypothetical protein HET69_33135 [Streptomyces sp. CJ_13]|nr:MULTISPECIES: hypothetical protein [unclassified Streptomyces]AYV25367.1 hypothetical protein EES41_01305 [Streptomyces sp. ADI95-16]MBT1188699.1 hypothetical protein [Streptomyces sp. CJ_13]
MTEKDLYADEPELVVTAVAGDEDAHAGSEEGVPAEETAQARNLMQQGQC